MTQDEPENRFDYGESTIDTVPSIIVGTLDGNLISINSYTGNVLWKLDTGGPLIHKETRLFPLPEEDGKF